MADYLNHIHGTTPGQGSSLMLQIDDIEHDISSDISSLLRNPAEHLFLSDMFKCSGHGIDIVYPAISYPGKRGLASNPDSIRFLLSLYPVKERLRQVNRIILQPRHIEMNGIELVSLYMRRKKILVMYLHAPHFYNVDDSDIDDYSFLSYYFYQYLSGDSTWTACVDHDKTVNRIPPLWHILSVISPSRDELIDKFFITSDDSRFKSASADLERISEFFSRRGY